MGSFREGEGTPPPDNGGVPDLPPEWGVVVIPDDPSELDRESLALRRQRRRSLRHAKWRRRLGLPARTGAEDENPPVGTPLLIMAIAIVAALTSLFAITLSTRTGAWTSATTQSAPAPKFTPQMMNLSLADATGNEISLQKEVPAVILVLDGCSCDQLIQQTYAAAAPIKINVIVVDRGVPTLPGGVKAVALADPDQSLVATFGAGPDHNADPAKLVTAILVDSSKNVRTFSHANAIADFSDALATIGR